MIFIITHEEQRHELVRQHKKTVLSLKQGVSTKSEVLVRLGKQTQTGSGFDLPTDKCTKNGAGRRCCRGGGGSETR